MSNKVADWLSMLICSICAMVCAMIFLGVIDWTDLGSFWVMVLLALMLSDLTNFFSLLGSWLMGEGNPGDKHRGFILWIIAGALIGSLLPLTIMILSDDFGSAKVKFLGICSFSGMIGALTYRTSWLFFYRRFGENWYDRGD